MKGTSAIGNICDATPIYSTLLDILSFHVQGEVSVAIREVLKRLSVRETLLQSVNYGEKEHTLQFPSISPLASFFI